MQKDNVIEFKKPEPFVDDPITNILRTGARKLLPEALEAEIEGEEVGKGVIMRWVISEKDGAENFFMRIIDAETGTQGPPMHSHAYEHEMYILEGQGLVVGDEGEKPFKSGDVIFIPPNERHEIKYPGGLRFI